MTAKARPASAKKTKPHPHKPKTKKLETTEPETTAQWSIEQPNGPIEDPPEGGQKPGELERA